MCFSFQEALSHEYLSGQLAQVPQSWRQEQKHELGHPPATPKIGSHPTHSPHVRRQQKGPHHEAGHGQLLLRLQRLYTRKTRVTDVSSASNNDLVHTSTGVKNRVLLIDSALYGPGKTPLCTASGLQGGGQVDS